MPRSLEPSFLFYIYNVCCDASLYACSLECHVICSLIPVCTLKVFVLTVVCIISSCEPIVTALFVFSLPGIPVWACIQLIVGLCDNLDATSLMDHVVVFNSSYPFFSMFLSVKESACIVILSLLRLASSSVMRIAVISTSIEMWNH